jgi:hypothetical protein
MRRLCLLLALLLAPVTAEAHDHIADAFLGFCFARASNLPGTQVTWAQTIPANRNVSILGDVNFHGGEHDDVDIKRFVYLVGARYTIDQLHNKFVPSVHVLTGSVVDNAGPQEGGKGALAFGGAFDVLFKDQPEGAGLRVLIEYVINGGDNYLKYGFGYVYRIHQ